MKLEIHERLTLLDLLPKQGDYAELQALRKAREIFSFTQDEIDFYEMKLGDDNKWHWDGTKAYKRVHDAPIEQYLVETIRKALAEMESNQTPTWRFLLLVSVYTTLLLS